MADPGKEWRRVTSTKAPPYYEFTKPIVKSDNDDRQYRVIQLENGLQATLMHDANADKAAASLDVAVGHLYDPDDMPGLAHFCEHLLFMGTKQFPRENEYSEFLAKNNGGSNAYTSTSNTNYYFNVGTHALPGALQRFAAFFHSPLFAPSCTSRELNAVDSEHKKNHQSDMWRIFQVSKHLSKEGHVWRKFGSGSRESLSQAARNLKARRESATPPVSTVPSAEPSPLPSRIGSPVPSVAGSEGEEDGGSVGRETRRRLVEWWNHEYCASRMRLAVIGKESLDELSELASTLFSPIVNRGQEALPTISEHPLGPNERGTLVSVKTIMSFHALEIGFPLEYQPPFWKHKPAVFLSHFIGHEGPGSLYSYLKNKGWVTSLSCGSQNLARGFAMFRITMYLTQDGFMHYREAIRAAFQYLALLRSSQFDAFHQQELAKLSEISFRFSEKKRPDDYASWLSEIMAWPVPRELLLSAPQTTWDWDSADHETKVRGYLDSFRLAEGRLFLMATGNEHAKVNPNARWEKEPWYGTEYNVERFSAEFIEQAEAPNENPDLFLPQPNEFIPTNLDVEKRSIAEPLKRPHLIRETPLSLLWHKKDDRFYLPKAHVVIDLRSPEANTSPRAAVMTKLYSDIVNDSLSEYSYDADLAGLSYQFVQHPNGLHVSMSGYNDKMAVLVKHVLEKIKAVTVQPDRLEVMKEQAKRDWCNFFLGQSYTLSDYFARYILSAQQWILEDKLKELDTITPEEIQQHMKKLLSQVHIRMLVSGNMYKDEAIRMVGTAEEGLGLSPVPPIELNDYALVLPDGSNFTWTLPLPNPNQANSSLTYYCHFGSITDQHLRVTSSLLTQILSEPAFNVLRTQEQLGYIVTCTGWLLAGGSEKGLRIVVQSEKNPGYLEDRVETFLDSMKTHIEDMHEEVFLEQKHGLEKKWLEADKNLMEETTKFMTHINTGHWDFLRNEKDARFLQGISKSDVLKLFMTRVHPSSKTRAKLSIHMRTQKSRTQKISVTAANAFEALVREASLDLDEKAWTTALGTDTPLVTDFTDYWKQILASKNGVGHLPDAIAGLVEKYPVDGEGVEIERPGVTYISDLKTFRQGLRRSVDPGPMVYWGDLPTSRF